MNNPEIRLAWTDFVLDLQDLLQEHHVTTPLYIVGGAVRDAYMRGPISDIDVAVDGDAIGLARQVTDWYDGDIFVMDDERGVARVYIKSIDGNIVIDFARFRADTIEGDLLDRDFTVNAMAADLSGDVEVLIDPMNGAQDLNQKILRRCTPHSIKDDPIRVLRAVRQSVQLNLKIHPETLQDIRRNAERIQESSFERVRDEFYKTLESPKPSRAIRVLQHLGILHYIIPDIDQLVGIEQSYPHRFDVWNHTLIVMERLNTIITAISYKRTDNTAATFDLGMLVIQLDRYRSKLAEHINRKYGNGRSHRALLILTALVHNLGKVDTPKDHVRQSGQKAQKVASLLRLTNEEQKSVKIAVQSYRAVLDRPDWTDLEMHRFWYALDDQGIDTILLAVADYLGTVGSELEQLTWLTIVERVTILFDAYFNRYDSIVNPTMLLNGNDIMRMLELKGSPLIGKLLTALREAQVTGEVSTVESARDFIRKKYRSLNA